MYDKYSKILYTKVSYKMTYGYANSEDPDSFQSSLIRVYTVCNSTKYFEKQLHKKQNLGQKIWNKAFEISGHLPYLSINNSEQDQNH